MWGIIVKISATFVTMAVGFVAYKVKFVKPEAHIHLTDLILNICLPAMIIYSIAQNRISKDSFAITVEMLLYSTVYFALAAMVSVLLVKAFRIKEVKDVGVYKILFTSINAGFIGFPLSKLLFGDLALYLMVLLNIILNLVMYSFCILQLNSGEREPGMLGSALKSMVNPCIISALVAVVLLFSGVRIPAYINGILQPIGDATIPLAMMVVGMQLAEGSIRDAFRNKKLLGFSVVTVLVWPMLVLAMVKCLPIHDMIKVVLVLAASMPTATTISAMAAKEGQNYKLGADGIVVTTLLSAGTLPVISMAIYSFL